ncbi:MAG TPA: carbohydrate kinase [Mycobacteriales bacterium]|nr:carbohydrate kinase [Mycobacteriales bacterium]
MIAVCGEALVDLFPVDATTFTARPGGSPANTAVALARLGTPTTMVARLSRDTFGRQLRAHLANNRVDLRVAVDTDDSTAVALVTSDARGAPTYRFFLEGAADWGWTLNELPQLPAEVRAVHAGSLALAKSPALERLLLRMRPRATICIDPNVRPAVPMPEMKAALDRWLNLADIIKASAEDLALLAPGADPIDVASSWQRRGVSLVIVTLGADGALAVFGEQVLTSAALRVDVVDTVGAGDAFTAGLLHAMHRGGLLGGRLERMTSADVEPVLAAAVEAAGRACEHAGAQATRGPRWLG